MELSGRKQYIPLDLTLQETEVRPSKSNKRIEYKEEASAPSSYTYEKIIQYTDTLKSTTAFSLLNRRLLTVAQSTRNCFFWCFPYIHSARLVLYAPQRPATNTTAVVQFYAEQNVNTWRT
ncbi:hypothetical protein OUZ56_001504 [Daphnia magna]|uniref:Uncharacterized protein n=1 Tax=Daphnia magna TaxID=35525 RepID=A0ABR0A2V3_9CRUS|nr:hypothetical protein OUZ56_001504 [Daphnia magna]